MVGGGDPKKMLPRGVEMGHSLPSQQDRSTHHHHRWLWDTENRQTCLPSLQCSRGPGSPFRAGAILFMMPTGCRPCTGPLALLQGQLLGGGAHLW